MQVNMYLYPYCDKWFRGGNIWLYSDPHFGDEEMKYIRKNYIGDEEQIKRINSKVGKNDTIIFLGDIGDVECIKKIRGYKILVKGNHDDKGDSYYQRVRNEVKCFSTEPKEVQTEIAKCVADVNLFDKLDEVVKKYTTVKIEDNRLFDEVYDGPIMINNKIMLSHEPLVLPPCFFNIHGHDHSDGFALKYGDDLHLNVCAELIDYTPISLLSMLKNGAFSKVQDIHRITIDTATERKRKRSEKN